MRSKFHTLSLPNGGKTSVWQSEVSDDQRSKKLNQNYSKLRLDDLIIDKSPEYRIKTTSDIKMSQIVKQKIKFSQSTNIEWMYNYKSNAKLHQRSIMKDYLQTVIEENKLKPTIGQFHFERTPYLNHYEFIREKYDQRKKIFQNPRQLKQILK